MVNKWFSARAEESITHTIDLATPAELKSFCYLYFEYFESFASNVWVWRILSPNHEGNLNRKERIILLYTRLMLSAAMMAMFFGRTALENVEEENENRNVFFLSLVRTLVVLFISSIISFPIGYVIEFLFRNAKFVHETYEVYKPNNPEASGKK